MGFFEKPYEAGELLATIRQTLGAPADPGDFDALPIRTWIINETTASASAATAGA